MKKHFLLLLAALFVAVGTARADATPSGYWSDNADTGWGSNYAESNEFYISTAAQLARFAYMMNSEGRLFAGKTVRLTADIDLSAHYWKPIGYKEAWAFAGTFDGEGHTISGVSFGPNSFSTSGNVFCGVFGVNGAKGTVRNINVANSTFEAVYNVGGVVAYNWWRTAMWKTTLSSVQRQQTKALKPSGSLVSWPATKERSGDVSATPIFLTT